LNARNRTKTTCLSDTHGQHIANLIGEQLHAPTGQNIGHMVKNQGIFIDMQGRYLGEIVAGTRLMYSRSSGLLVNEFRQLR
jgi:hypothetical protein